MTVRAFRRFAIGVLGYNVLVSAWGAYVRASGSGAGCGSHWPLCNGELLPRAPRLQTLIEFSHRASAGLALVSAVALAWAAFVSYPRGSLVRKGAFAVLFFELMEAAVGAAIVLFRLVADNETMARAMFMSAHLVNTFFLLAAATVTVLWAYELPAPRLRHQGTVGAVLAISIGGLLLLGMSGAVTALGDTLFPARTLAEGLQQDFSATAHIFLRLRKWHPVIAVLMACFVTAAGMFIAALRPSPTVKRASTALIGLFLIQLAIGAVNVAFLAPVPVQLLHLLGADAVWIALVSLTAGALAAAPALEPSTSGVVEPS